MIIDPTLPESLPHVAAIGEPKLVILNPKTLRKIQGHTWVDLYLPSNSRTPTHANEGTDKHYTVVSGVVKVFTFDEHGKVGVQEFETGMSFTIEANKPHFLAVLNYGCNLTMWRVGDVPNAKFEPAAKGAEEQGEW